MGYRTVCRPLYIGPILEYSTVFNAALKSRVFLTRWKVAWLVLLQKPGKPIRHPSLFRPLRMLDTIGKIFEQVIAERLRKHFWGKQILNADQYGVRAGCSTIDAAGKLKKLAVSAMKKHQFGAAISLDIQNAINLMSWTRILEALANAKVLVYLRNIIQDYFQDWGVFTQTASSMVERERHVEYHRDQSLDPYYGISPSTTSWRRKSHRESASSVTPTTHWWSRLKTIYSCAQVEGKHHLWGYKLSLATTKMEAVLFTHCRQFSPHLLPKGGQIRLCTALKYLGLWFDGKLAFKEHVKKTAAKAEKVIGSLSRLMSLGRPNKGKRKLLTNVVMSVILYGAPIRADTINARA